VIEDLGSGVLVNLEKYGLAHEPTVQEAVEAGVDVICFSGDKLLGGPQAGIIIGKKQYIAAMKKNPLTRAVRVDKFTVTALELALLEYLNPETVKERIPVLKMMSEPAKSVKQRGELLLGMMREKVRGADLAMCECRSQIGGGSLPTEQIASWAVVIRPHRMSIERLEESMRHMPVPVIGRVQEDAFWLDVRTIDEREFETVAKMFGELKYVPEYEV
jgi:L-seryl-tRNA(Ser) seleniumtransferase